MNPLMGALRRAEREVEFVTVRHEEMAAFMATGHAKYTGEVGVCLATQGPGAVHLLTGLYDAKLDRKPVVAIVGQVVTTALGSGYQQEVDLENLFKDVCAQYVQRAATPEQFPLVLDNAVRTALASSSPTCVIVPHDVQQQEWSSQKQEHGVISTSAARSAPRVLPNEQALQRAVEILAAGKRPALLVGQGGYGAAEEIMAVADRLGAGLTVSLLGKPVLDESHPMHCGVMGHLGTTASADLMAQCDTLLIVGSSDPWVEFYPKPGQARVVQIDIAERNLGAKYPVECGVAGDAAETLRALLERLPSNTTDWRATVVGMVTTWEKIRAQRVAESTEGLNPQRVLHALNEHLPADVQVAVDVGSVTYWYARFLRLPTGAPAHLCSTLASMGSALPYGLAAKLARPDQPVVALAGDGAMQMNGLLELITVADRWPDWADPRFVVLVLNNGDLSEVSWEQRESEGEPRFSTSQRVPPFRYAEYAEQLGLRGIQVTPGDELTDAWREAWAAGRPCLVEAIVDPDTPLLPPRQPQSVIDTMLHGLTEEGNELGAAMLRRQVAQEGGPAPDPD